MRISFFQRHGVDMLRIDEDEYNAVERPATSKDIRDWPKKWDAYEASKVQAAESGEE